MKTEGLFDINREPAKISCVLKVAQGALKEHNKSRILTAQRHAIESYVLASPGDLVTLHIEADPHIADSFDVYCDGILRFTQPNTDHTRKFKPDVKKVYYQGPVTGKKSDGPKLYSMMVQLREKSRDLDTTDNASSAVGSIVVKCWQKKTEGLFVGHATDPSVPNFSTHSEWHNLTSNVGTDSSLPALQIGFVNGRNVTKPKPGTKPSDVVDEAAKRDDSTYELIHELIFHVRTITELRGLGFADGSDQSNAPESKPVKKSKKVVVIAEEDDAEGDADIEEIDCSGPIPPLPPALLHQIVHHLHAPDSGGVDIPETEFREVEQEAIIPTAPSDVQNSEVQPSEVAIDEPVQTVEAEHVSQLREQTVDFQEATIPTPPTDTLNSKVQLSEPAIIEPGLSVESEHVSPLKEQSAEIQNTMDAEEEHRTQQVETDAKDEGTLSELDPVPAPAEAGASILDSEAPKSSQATTTSKDRILKGLPNGPATEAFRKKAAAYAVAVQSTDEYNEEPIAVDTSPEIGAIASRILASVLLTPPNPAEKPGFIDIFDRLLPKTLSQATTLSYVESLGRVDTTMVDGLNFSRFPLDLQGGSMIVGDDAMTDIAPEEDILRAVETEEASPSFRVSDVAADEAMQSIESSVLASAVTLIREEPLRQDARAISSPPDLRTVTPASHSGRSSQLDTQHLTPVFTEKCESSLSDKPQSRDPVIRRLFSDAAYASPKRLGEQSASNARPQKSQKLGNSRSSSLSSVQSSTSHTSFKRPAEEPALNDRQPKSRKLSEPSRLSVSQLLAANAPPNLAATGSAVTNTTTDVPAGSEPEHARAKSSVDTTQESSLKTSLSQSFTSTQVPTQAAATSKVPAFQLLQSQETKVASSVDTTQLNQSAATCALLQILVQGSTANKLQVSPQLPAQESKVKTANNRGLTLEQLQAQASAVEAKRREEEVKLEETQQRLTAMKHIREKREACERLRIQREQVEREIMDMESS